VVAFRGTYSIANTIADLSTIPQQYVPYPGGEDDDDETKPPECANCTVHMGFYDSWQNTKDEILPHVEQALQQYPGYQLTLVGHSLGGAVAALAALELLSRGYFPTVTTFGEPRLGNRAFADYLDSRFHLSNGSIGATSLPSRFRRVTHLGDPVPLLPIEEWGYTPHSGEIFIAQADIPPELGNVYHCQGPYDPNCSTGSRSDWENFPWGVPTRFKLWQLLFAHRDYFWRLGLCAPDI
jgi:pimeloyl-ACP methyl ester carboxylesterase